MVSFEAYSLLCCYIACAAKQMETESSEPVTSNTDFEMPEDVNILENLPDHVNPLVAIFEERMKVENDFEREIWQLRKKYDDLFDQSAVKIKKIVENIDQKEEIAYWAECLLNCQDVAEFIMEVDEPVLNYLIDVRSITITEDHPSTIYPDFKDIGLIIEFEFKPNPYFTNTVLYKYFKLTFDVELKDAIDGRGAPYCYDTLGCTINWNEGKNITEEKVMKTQRHKETQKVRTVTKVLKRESFFSFFDTPKKVDDQFQAGMLGQCPDLDYLLGEWIANVVVRRSLHFFIGPIDCDMNLSGCDSLSDDLDDTVDILGGEEDAEVANLSKHLKTFGMAASGTNIGKNKPPANSTNHNPRSKRATKRL